MIRAAEGSPLRSLAAVVCAFTLSGFAALVYQVAWQRILGVFSGVHSWSITVIVTAFMAGLGFGSIAGGRLADRLSSGTAARAFAACELLVALFGAMSPWLYYDLAYAHLGSLVRHPMALPLVHFGLLIVPTLLMGASLPLLARAVVVSRGPSAAQRIAWLYAANTLGAALGAFATAWWLAGAIGFTGTIRVAAGLNVAAAGLALLFRPGGSLEAAAGNSEEAGGHAPAVRLWAATSALAGFIALGLEMVWLRVLGTMIKASPHTFGHVIALLLVALGLGGVYGAGRVARAGAVDAGSVFLRLQWAAVVAAALPFVAMPLLLADGSWLGFLFQFLGSDSPLPIGDIVAALSGERPGRAGVLRLAAFLWVLVPLAVVGPAAFLMGASYAWIQRAVQTDLGRVGRRAGVIQAANVFGCALGSAMTGLVLFELLGTPRTLCALVALAAAFGWLLARRGPPSVRGRRAALGVGLPVALAMALPGHERFWSALHGSRPREAVVVEDSSSVVSLQPSDRVEAVMRVNGIGHSNLPYGSVWTLLGVLPVLVHGQARRVLIIGMATGATPWAAAKMPGVERVDLYEIARPEHRALVAWERRHRAHPEVREFLDHPRIRTSFTDGRLALRLEPTLYDVVEADAAEPYMAYSGNLYSRDFFLEVRRRLAQGGLFCTYVPSRRVAETMKAAFPFVLDLTVMEARIMLGSERPLPLDVDRLLERMASPELRASFGSTPRGEELLAHLVPFVRAMKVTRVDPATPRSAPDVNTDLFPRDEFDWKAGLEP